MISAHKSGLLSSPSVAAMAVRDAQPILSAVLFHDPSNVSRIVWSSAQRVTYGHATPDARALTYAAAFCRLVAAEFNKPSSAASLTTA